MLGNTARLDRGQHAQQSEAEHVRLRAEPHPTTRLHDPWPRKVRIDPSDRHHERAGGLRCQGGRRVRGILGRAGRCRKCSSARTARRLRRSAGFVAAWSAYVDDLAPSGAATAHRRVHGGVPRPARLRRITRPPATADHLCLTARPGSGDSTSDLGLSLWSGRPGSNRHGQLGRLRPLRRQRPRSAVRPSHGYPLLTVVYRG
jgi:hypothetical protein